jgi:DNA-binding NarL/FixJ family response regulator
MSCRILLVDDHELVRTGLRLRLQHEEDMEVVGDAADAAAAYALIEAHAPDLVVMDIDLPDENGLVATTKIKARWPKTRVLALTGSNPPGIVRAALRAGVDGLVFKNEASDELVRAVRTVAAGKVFLSPEAATVLAVNLRKSATPSPLPPCSGPDLSDRERSVLKGLADGLSYKELAAELGVSVKSVDTYRARLGKKLGCTNRAELIRYAMRLGLVQI